MSNLYFYQDLEGTLFGPFTKRQLLEWNLGGYLDPQLLVRKDPETDFRPLSEFPELFEQGTQDEVNVGADELKKQETLFNVEPKQEKSESLQDEEQTNVSKKQLQYFRCKVCGGMGTDQPETAPQPHYWYRDLGDRSFGPFPFRQIAEWLSAKYFGPITHVARCIHDGKGALATIDKSEFVSEETEGDIVDESSDEENDENEEEETKPKKQINDEMETEDKEKDKVKEWKTEQLKKQIKDVHEKAKPLRKGRRYPTPPNDCFIEVRRYPEFSLYLAEGVHMGRLSAGAPGPRGQIIDLSGKNVVQEIAAGIVQTVYDVAKNVEALEKQSENPQISEPVPSIPVPTEFAEPVEPPRIVIPEQYQEYPTNAAFNKMTGQFEGSLNSGAMYDYRMFTMTNRSQHLQQQLTQAVKETAAANEYGRKAGQSAVYNPDERHISRYMDLDKYQQERQAAKAEEQVSEEAKKRARKRQRKKQRMLDGQQ